jgi:hypothetical protein
MYESHPSSQLNRSQVRVACKPGLVFSQSTVDVDIQGHSIGKQKENAENIPIILAIATIGTYTSDNVQKTTSPS